MAKKGLIASVLHYSFTAPYYTLYALVDSLLKTPPGRTATQQVNNISAFLTKCIVLWLITVILLMASAILYFTIHYSMMPTMLVVVPVHFQFSQCEPPAAAAECGLPSAQVFLMDSSGAPLLHPHVPYTINLELVVPESEANTRAGLFMVGLNLTTASGQVVGTSSRMAMLHYRSPLHQTLRTLLLSPLLLTGYSQEEQTLTTQHFTSYLVHEDKPPTSARLRLSSRLVQLYSARLVAHARLSGVRRIMYYHPLVSGVLGTWCTFCTLGSVFLVLWLRTSNLQLLRRIPLPSAVENGSRDPVNQEKVTKEATGEVQDPDPPCSGKEDVTATGQHVVEVDECAVVGRAVADEGGREGAAGRPGRDALGSSQASSAQGSASRASEAANSQSSSTTEQPCPEDEALDEKVEEVGGGWFSPVTSHLRWRPAGASGEKQS